jgi:hypothetical protein
MATLSIDFNDDDTVTVAQVYHKSEARELSALLRQIMEANPLRYSPEDMEALGLFCDEMQAWGGPLC